MANEPLLTRYRIFTSTDEGTTWTYLATQDANSRDTALRKQFANPPVAEVLAVAVSESSFRPQRVATRVTTSLTEQALPGETLDGPAAPDDEPDGTPTVYPSAAASPHVLGVVPSLDEPVAV